VHGCGWDSVGQPESAAAHWLPPASVASGYALGADGVGAARPGARGCRGSRVTASRYALGAKGGGAARPGAYLCPRVTAHVVSWGEWGCRRSLVLRAAREARCKACFGLLPRARVGWHTARTLLPPPPPRSSGAPVRWLMARGRRASGVAGPPLQGLAPPASRPRAAGAPWEARARAAHVQTAGENLWWWWCAHQLRITSGRLPLIGGSIYKKHHISLTIGARGSS